MSRQDFTTTNQSVGAVIQITDCGVQVGWRRQLMASRLAGLSQASEASQISPPRQKGPSPKNKSMYPAFKNPSCKYANPICWMVGTSGKRLLARLISSWRPNSCGLTALSFARAESPATKKPFYGFREFSSFRARMSY